MSEPTGTGEAPAQPASERSDETTVAAEGAATVGETLEAAREMGAALLGLARLEVARAGRGLVGALVLGVAALVLVGVCIVLVVTLLLVGLLKLSGSLLAALALTALLAGGGIWLLLHAARRMLRPLALPATRAELHAVFEPLRKSRT